jgi:DNA polymerase-3 subunit alpha
MITCQTAYLKAHYPVEYMTALLSVARNDTAKIALYAADARRQGLAVLPPDINQSGLDFTIETTADGAAAIRFGLAAVKNVGAGAVQAILDARAAHGPFQTLDAFCQQVDLRQVGKRPLECLIKVGALDSLGGRAQLLDGLDQIVNASTSHFRAAEAGQLSFFGGPTSTFTGVELGPAKSEFTRRELLSWEKELIGLYVSDHPLQPVMAELQLHVTDYSQQLTEDDHGRGVIMAGVVTNLRPYFTKKGDQMGFVSVEDLQGHLELVVFPRTWKEVSPWLTLEQIIVIYGKVDSKGQGQPKIIVDQLKTEFDNVQAADPEVASVMSRPAPAARPTPPPVAQPATPVRRPAPAPIASAATAPAHATAPARRPVIEDDAGPAPWMDDEIPLPDDDWQPYDEAPPAPPQTLIKETATPAPSNGNGYATHAAAADEARGGGSEVAAPSNGHRPNGNGHQHGANGNGRAAPTPSGAANGVSRTSARREARPVAGVVTPAANEPPRRVTVTVQASGDKDKDRRRMKRLHGLLVSYPGQDQFEFSVQDYNERSYLLRFPNDTTGFCPPLERQLQELLGEGMVAVQPL